jgi:hypothetical protein
MRQLSASELGSPFERDDEIALPTILRLDTDLSVPRQSSAARSRKNTADSVRPRTGASRSAGRLSTDAIWLYLITI